MKKGCEMKITKVCFSWDCLEEHILNSYGSVMNGIKEKSSTKLISDSIETLYADMMGGVVENEKGFDVLIGKERHEIKSTTKLKTNGHFRINGLSHKEGNCDYISVVDVIHNRLFVVPSKTFFKEGLFYISKNNFEFCWSGTYNETDLNNIPNTSLLLKYEFI